MKSDNPLAHTSTRILILFFVIAAFIGAAALWWKDAIAPVSPQDTESVIFVVRPGDSGEDIALNLSSQKLIRSAIGFRLLLMTMGIERDLQAGDFRLNRTMNATQVAEELTHGSLDVWVTTLEGWRVEEVANKLAKELDIPEQLFLEHAKEGYMFPDTYLIPREATPAAIAQLFLNTFELRTPPEMRRAAQNVGLTFEEAVVLASIVEREGRSNQDRPIIAGILLNRLNIGMPLQVDATLQYALGYQAQEKTWWKRGLTDADKKVVSPYNTNAHPGLPPAPIANPGLASIQAVLYPEDSEYFYYLHDPSGVAHYATTLDEHNANVREYLQ